MANSYHTILRMLRNTSGYMIGNCWQQEELAASGIRSLHLTDAPVRLNLVLVRRQRQELSGCASQFLEDFLRDQNLP